MKKTVLLVVALATIITMQAQWVDDSMNNTFIANTLDSASEIYISTDEVSGDTYIQWTAGASNGWAPYLQRLNYEGVPQWDADGIHITTPNLASWSPGYAMTATDDGGVVSIFRTADAHHYAVRVNADGTFPWGETGLLLFEGEGGGRSEILAGKGGGVWVLGTDMDNSFLQYVEADGTLNPMITLSGDKKITNGLLVPAEDGVFVVYAKQIIVSGINYQKELYVAGYNKDGEQIYPEVQLMAPHTMRGSLIHYAVSDGMGGGYVFTWHAAFSNALNTYVFHFDENGNSTINDLDGTPVHSIDPYNYYMSAYATVDPVSHDLLIAYRQTDASAQVECKLFVNRITSTGERLWGEGMLVIDNGTTECGGTRIDAFEQGGGFSVIFHKGVTSSGYNSTVEARGYDMDFNPLWSTQMCSNTYPKAGDENSSGYHLGQNIVAWVNSADGGLYGQNIGINGEMGEITPPTPPDPCYAPTNFDGSYYYSEVMFGALLSWEAPDSLPLHYNLYRDGVEEAIEIDAEYTSYFLEMEPGNYVYRLTAVYDNCESEYALTSTGEDYVTIEVTSVSEDTDETIVNVTKVYNMKGQVINCGDLKSLNPGIYILQGVTSTGKLVSRKIMVSPIE